MIEFNITAQIYNNKDIYKQTLLINNVIKSSNKESAKDLFKLNLIENNEVLVKILSIEELKT